MRPLLRVFVLATSVSALAACGPPPEPEPEPSGDPPQEQGDPCAPHGHIHREPTGDWCHCDRGYLAAEQGLSCQQDPNYVPREGFDFGDNGKHACWHVTNGPFATVSASVDRQPRVDAFHTHYTVKLRPEGGQYVGTFNFKGYATGDFVVYLSDASVPVSLREGARLVEPVATAPVPPEVCTGLVHMVGYELTDKVQYTVSFGPTSLPELGLVIEHLE
ncbi:hypothetical protein [Vitiosangium sp. GDMCC 1.1324]|uniref:hypothetical protein n=1 Tax=Vitiosangium sp. (strain GDMCC 1.1324) TaxID=2138576 RepID=UPI000D3B777D|nr:hypothetical protein [Vitiosangium sp. GDMCC 1.1324]PTL80660.1 hypothetical protein DAT35_28980 [Vitiosangium sp. GDMCC 1.1324]